MNEGQLYEILKIHIIMYNILELEKNAKQGKTLRFQKMSFSDGSDSVTLTLLLIERLKKPVLNSSMTEYLNICNKDNLK